MAAEAPTIDDLSTPRPLRAGEVMLPSPTTLREDWTLPEALRALREHDVLAAPVVGARGEVLGTLSTLDISRACASAPTPPCDDAEYYRSPTLRGTAPECSCRRRCEHTVREAMAPLVIDAPESMPLSRVAVLMDGLGIHRVLVTRGRLLLGVVERSQCDGAGSSSKRISNV